MLVMHGVCGAKSQLQGAGMGPQLKAGFMAGKPQRLGQIVVSKDKDKESEDEDEDDNEDEKLKAMKATRHKTKGKQQDEQQSHAPAPMYSAVSGDLLFKAQPASQKRYGAVRITNLGITREGGEDFAEAQTNQRTVAEGKLRALLERRRLGAELIFQKFDHGAEGLLTVEACSSALEGLHIGLTANELQAFVNYAVIHYGAADDGDAGNASVRIDYVRMLKDMGGEMTRGKLEVEMRERQNVSITHPTGLPLS